MSKNLVIVESPAKAKTIEKFLGQDFQVKSSYGHVRDLEKKELGIKVDEGFLPIYKISEDKTKIVNELKKLAKTAETVWLASDEDREGEAIAWHLKEALGLDESKIKRIVFNEITKTAILNAIENPRKIDIQLVDAQQARRILDRLVGYEISPILWSKIKPSLSAGRVQSVAVRLIVERENEIKAFETTSFYRVTAQFSTLDNQKKLAAELSKRFDNKEEAHSFLTACLLAAFAVESVEKKPAKRSPAPPFTTSTLQQEASRKLGFPVAKTMVVAQQLYELGYITYMRTDSVNLSSLALDMAKEEITKLYGEKYLKTRKFSTKTKGAQEAHEAIRPTNLGISQIDGDPSQKRLYELIWKRAIASQMSDAEMEKTTININISNREENFVAQGEVILFDGFLKVYMESNDDEPDETQEGLLPALHKGEMLQLLKSEAVQRFTQHPPRYTEASLVKKLEDLGIGRPSTYAPTISTIQKREYIVKEDRDGVIRPYTTLELEGRTIREISKTEKTGFEKAKLFPTDIGVIVNQFLVEHFDTIIDYNFTANVEKDFDEVALGKKSWTKVIEQFYKPFHRTVENTARESQKMKGERLLGVDPKTGKNVYAKLGRYGTLVQIGETSSPEKPAFASMKKGQSIESITLEEALSLFLLPRISGNFEGKEMHVAIGRFGPYIRHDNKFYSLGKTDDPYTVTEERCIEIIKAKRIQDAEKEKLKELLPRELGNFEGESVTANTGRFGPYVTYKKKNYKLPKDADVLAVSLNEALEVIKKQESKKKAK